MKHVLTLQSNWQLAQCAQPGPWADADLTRYTAAQPDGELDWLPCEMPAQVHDVLGAHGKIRDPREIGACRECLWVAQNDWVYRTNFSKPAHGDRVYLHFEGLDTVVDVYLNGELIAEHKDGFLPLRSDVTDHLRDDNQLALHFYAPEPWLAQEPRVREFVEAGGKPNKAIRKPVEDFGFFNGPKPSFTPIGIYAPVRLEMVDRAEIRHLDIAHTFPDSHYTARVELRAEVDAVAEADLKIRWTITDPDGETVFERTSPDLDQVAEIHNARLWYPHTHGDQPLYTVTAQLLAGSAFEPVDEMTRRIGLREVVRLGDFAFLINGLRIRLWGANLTPLPVPSHVCDEDMLGRTLDLVEQARMPVIRVWGPSQPWPDLLVEEADRRGIMLWMEFAHTGPGHPAEDWYNALCRAEAVNWVKRWKHAPSILFWSGGNEAYLGLESAEPDPNDPERRLFEEVYRGVIEEHDPQRWYIPNSPFGGQYGNDPREGDCHVRDYQIFQPGHEYAVLPSENIRLTIALEKTLRRHFGEDLQWPENGFTGARTHFNDPVIPEPWLALTPDQFWVNVRVGCQGELFDADGSPQSLLFRIGAGSALFIRKTVERLRRGRPAAGEDIVRRCEGYQWWKLNDTFPMIYASLIDDQIEPNMAYYALRRAYAPLQVSTEIDEDGLHFWVVNDSDADFRGNLRIRRLDVAGREVLDEMDLLVNIAQGESEPVGTGAAFQAFPRCCPLHLELFAKSADNRPQPVVSNLCYVAPERENWFPEDAEISLRCEAPETLVVSADKIARWVELKGASPEGDEFGWYFEDNFFDLVPGHEHRVKILGNHRKGAITAHSRYSPHQAKVEIG